MKKIFQTVSDRALDQLKVNDYDKKMHCQIEDANQLRNTLKAQILLKRIQKFYDREYSNIVIENYTKAIEESTQAFLNAKLYDKNLELIEEHLDYVKPQMRFGEMNKNTDFLEKCYSELNTNRKTLL